jgi:N-acetylglucosamine kinase-like BadF-type ATPase
VSRVLGVDGGNSKTFALVSDAEGRLLGFARAEGSNHERIGFDETETVLRDVAHAALADAGADGPVDRGFWGLAGADLLSDFERLRAIVDRIHAAEKNVVKNDVAAAMGAGFTRGWGVGVISGAGFSAGGIAPDGREFRFPSLGAATGDWGGGEEIGLEVLRLAHRGFDGRGEPTLLADRVAGALGLASLEELPARIRADGLDRTAIRDRLPPLLFEVALEGDRVARDLVVRIGEEVGTTAATIVERLGMQGMDVEVVLGGSVFNGSGPLLTETVAARVRKAAPRARIVRPEFHPVVGAVFEALRGLGVDVDERVRANVRATLPAGLAEAGDG